MLDYVFRVLERDYLEGGRKKDTSVSEQVLKPTHSVKAVEAHASSTHVLSTAMPKLGESKVRARQHQFRCLQLLLQ